ncbi:LysR family transcriptional regulator [Microbacterium sp. Root61]|uniref:LysR family transcriptional regulator n=1 Tax=Microbacterium sp. Root61 TaxID=1736570 RepID=UPI0009EAA93D|nr:LysR family transcriptional regulator [Microbacterium sp. Root61]
MDLQQLRYFTAVATHGSISAGATAVGVTQPTISQALQGLEHEMKTQLFARVGRGMVLTSAGYALLGPARRVLRASGAARDTLNNRGRGLAGRLDVSMSPSALAGVVPRMLSTFLRGNKGVTLNARALVGDAEIPAVLHERLADVVFTRLPLTADPALGQDQHPLTVLEVGSSEVLFAEPPGDSPPDPLDDEPVPWHGRGTSRRILAPPSDYANSALNGPISALGVGDLPPVVAARRETRLALVAAGVGATYIGASLASTSRRHGVGVRTMEPPLIHRIGMVYDAAGLSDVAAAFVAVVRSEANARDRNASAAGDGGPSR